MQVNGEFHPFTPDLTLHDLLAKLEIPPQRIAVAINDNFYAGAQAPDCMLHEGDVIEIVKIIGGG